ncbi:MAG: flagellar basal body protein FliL [Methylophaga sp.]|nr:flagellar basal body protein FliL [Methylophaga sp.]
MTTSIRILFVLFLSAITFPTWAEDEPAAPPAAIYYKIPEPFTINFLNQSEKQVRYLQIKVTLMAHEQEVLTQAELNLPMVQDSLRTLFSEQSFETVKTVEGRKALQAKSLSTIKTILKEETGKDNLDAVYFTSFILQ